MAFEKNWYNYLSNAFNAKTPWFLVNVLTKTALSILCDLCVIFGKSIAQGGISCLRG